MIFGIRTLLRADHGRARITILLGLGLAGVLVSSMLAWAPWASAGDVNPLHGIGFSKGCAGPTLVGNPYVCTLSVQNTALADTAGDTLTFTSAVDVVHATPSDVSSGNILASLTVGAIAGGASCNVSGTSTGAGATGNTLCTLPSNSSITFLPFSFYTTDANDPNPLTDTATLTWQDTCSSKSNNCPLGNQTSTTGSQSTLHTATPTNTNTPTNTPTDTPTETPTETPENTPARTSEVLATETVPPTATNTPVSEVEALPEAGGGSSLGGGSLLTTGLVMLGASLLALAGVVASARRGVFARFRSR